MKFDTAKSSGVFTLKVEIGNFFPQKKRDDFTTDTEWDQYLEQITADAYLIFREPRTDEITGINQGSLPSGILGGLDEKTASTIIRNLQNQDKAQLDKSQAMVKACLQDHNFYEDEKEEKKISKEKVWAELILPRQKLMMEVFRIFFENMTLKKTNN